MKLTGSFHGISKDVKTSKFLITLLINEDITNSYQKIEEEKLNIEIVKHREKRSLDANAYFHVLVGKIAEVLRISKPRCKNILIGRYGQVDMIDNQPVMIKTQIPVSDMLEQENLHVLACGGKVEDNGTQTYFYKVYRGSSTYDTREMSVLIDGTVMEAKELGIETMTPEQLVQMKNPWKGEKSG